jgi:hypothetical protein
MSSILFLEAIIPRHRDQEADGSFVDSRFSPSFVDLGTLQSRASALAASHRLTSPFSYPEKFLSELEELISRHVRHVVSIDTDEENGKVSFTTLDRWGTYDYGFAIKKVWFARMR